MLKSYMFYNRVVLFVLLSVCASVSAASTFFDDFESGLGNWQPFSGNTFPTITLTTGPYGTTTNVMDTSPGNVSGAKTLQQFDYSVPGFTLSTDVQHTNGQSVKPLGLVDDAEVNILMFWYTGVEAYDNQPSMFSYQILSGGTQHVYYPAVDVSNILGGQAGMWHNMRATVRPDAYVDFFLDDQYVLTSLVALDFTHAGNAHVAIGSRDAYYDNVSVNAVPIPTAIVLLGSALAGLGFGQRKVKAKLQG